jgi:hypothetical protein
MAGERRAATDARFDHLEDSVYRLDWQVVGLKRRLDQVTKCCTVVVEGTKSLETAWVTLVETEPKQWRVLKGKVGEAVGRDLAEHLGQPWPLEGGEGIPGHLKSFVEALSSPDTVRNVHGQTKWDNTSQSRQRLPGVFMLQLTFGSESLDVARLLKVLDQALRRASGLKVHGEEPMLQEGAPPPRRVLVYLEKTAEERAKGKGKGKGKGGDGAAGKGKGGEPAQAGAPDAGGKGDQAADAGGAGQGAEAGAGDKGKGKAKGKGKGKDKGKQENKGKGKKGKGRGAGRAGK